MSFNIFILLEKIISMLGPKLCDVFIKALTEAITRNAERNGDIKKALKMLADQNPDFGQAHYDLFCKLSTKKTGENMTLYDLLVLTDEIKKETEDEYVIAFEQEIRSKYNVNIGTCLASSGKINNEENIDEVFKELWKTKMMDIKSKDLTDSTKTYPFVLYGNLTTDKSSINKAEKLVKSINEHFSKEKQILKSINALSFKTECNFLEYDEFKNNNEFNIDVKEKDVALFKLKGNSNLVDEDEIITNVCSATIEGKQRQNELTTIHINKQDIAFYKNIISQNMAVIFDLTEIETLYSALFTSIDKCLTGIKNKYKNQKNFECYIVIKNLKKHILFINNTVIQKEFFTGKEDRKMVYVDEEIKNTEE